MIWEEEPEQQKIIKSRGSKHSEGVWRNVSLPSVTPTFSSLCSKQEGKIKRKICLPPKLFHFSSQSLHLFLSKDHPEQLVIIRLAETQALVSGSHKCSPHRSHLSDGHQPQGLLGSIERTFTGKHRSAQRAEPQAGDLGACSVPSCYGSTKLPGTLVSPSIKRDKVLTIKPLQYSHLSIILSCGQDGRTQMVSPFWPKSCFLPSKTPDGNANILKIMLSDCFGPFSSYPQITTVLRSKMAKDTLCKVGKQTHSLSDRRARAGACKVDSTSLTRSVQSPRGPQTQTPLWSQSRPPRPGAREWDFWPLSSGCGHALQEQTRVTEPIPAPSKTPCAFPAAKVMSPETCESRCPGCYLLLGGHPSGGQLHDSGRQLGLDAVHAFVLLTSVKGHCDQPPEAGADR